MPSTLAANETDPHDIFVIEPDVVLAARVGHAAADPAQGGVHAGSAPPLNNAPDISVVSAVAAIESTLRGAAANDDIRVPRDIHPTTDRSFWGPWAKRASVGFAFALCSAVAAESWNHYGDSARAMIAKWTPAFAMTSSPSPATAEATQQATPATQAAAADPAPAPTQPAPDTASTAAAPAVVAALPDAPTMAAMSQEIAQLKATIEQLKAGQEQMAQQMAQQIARDAAKPAVVRTSPAKPAQAKTAQAKSAETNWRAKVTAALPPRPAPPPVGQPRPAYAPAPATYYPPQATYGSTPRPAPAPYDSRAQDSRAQDSRAQVTDPIDGAPVVRPPMPLQ